MADNDGICDVCKDPNHRMSPERRSAILKQREKMPNIPSVMLPEEYHDGLLRLK